MTDLHPGTASLAADQQEGAVWKEQAVLAWRPPHLSVGGGPAQLPPVCSPSQAAASRRQPTFWCFRTLSISAHL